MSVLSKLSSIVAKPVEQIIARGLKSKYLFATKKSGNQMIMLFYNPKSGNIVLKNIGTDIGSIVTYGYKGTRKVLFDNKVYSLMDAIGRNTLKANPEALAFSYTPSKAISECINPWLRYKSIASKGKVTHYDDFCGTLTKGKVENMSVDEFVNCNPFMH